MSSSISSVTTLVLSLALLFAAASGAQAQVTIESVVWNWGVGADSIDVAAVNTSIGSNTGLLAAVCLNNNDGQLPVSVTLDPGGASQTSLDWLDVGDQASSWSDVDDGHCTIWGVKNPPSGTNFIVRVLADTPTQAGEGLNVGVWSLSGVHQTTPFRDAVAVQSGTGTDAASITVPSVAGDLVFGAAFNEWYNGNTRLAKSGTGILDFYIPGVDSEDKTVGQHKTATGTSTTLTWTNDNDPSPKWAVIGVAVIPVPATCPGGSVCWDGGGGADPNWSNGLNWTGDAVPGAAALVVFNGLSSNPATFDVADAIGSLTIEAAYAGTITLAATMTNNGAFVMNGGNLTMGSTTVNQNNDWTYTAGVVNAGTSNVIFASTDLAVSSGAMTFNDVTLSLGGGNGLTVTGTMDVDGDLTISSIGCIGGTGTIAVSGNITTTDTTVCQSGTAKILIDGSGAQTIGASGGAGGLPAIEINNSDTLTIQDTIHMNDDWVFTGGTVDAGTSTVIFDGSDLSITTGTMAFNNVTVNYSGANTITLTDNFDIDGDLTLTNAGDGFSGAGVIEVAGDLTSTWVSCCTSNAITLDGANAQTVDIATGDITSGLFTINKTNPTDIVTLISAMTLYGSSQDLTITQGVLALGAFDLTVPDVLTVDANGDITCTTGTVSALSETGAGLPYSCTHLGPVGSWVTGTTHTAEAGSDRALILVGSIVGFNDGGSTISSASYGGQALTFIESRASSSTGPSSSGYDAVTEVWYLNEAGIAAASGSTFSVTWTGTPYAERYMSGFYTGVDQTNPIGAQAENFADAATPNPITTSALTNNSGDMVIVAAGGVGLGSYTAQNGFTEQQEQQYNGGCGDCFTHTVADKVATGANETPSIQHTSMESQQIIGFVLQGVTSNAIPTVTSAIPDTTVAESSPPIDNYRDLKAVFTDAEDGSALTYSIESNTNTGLVTASIVVADSTLDLSFTASTRGTATITVRATDSGGLWVEDVFTVMTSCPAGSVCWDGGGGGDPNWSNGLNWTGDVVPGYSGLVVFNHLSTNPATFNAVDTIGGFTIEAGYTGTITMAADLLIDHTTGCTFTQNGGTIDLGSVTWEHECPWTHTAGTFTAGTSTVKYRYSHIAMDAGTSVFNNVSIGIGATDFTVTDTMHVNGNLTITGIRNTTGTIAVKGNVTTTDLSATGSGHIALVGDGAQVLSASGLTGSLPGIHIDQEVGGTLAIQDTIKINGYLGAGWTYTAGDVDAGTSTVVVATAMTVNSGSMAFNNVILDSTTGMDLTVTGTMDVDGDLTITTIRNVKSGTITVAGNLTSTQTGVGNNTGFIILDGANAQSIDINLGDVPDGLFTINKTLQADIVTLSSAMNLSASGQDLTLTSGTLDMAGFNLAVTDVLTLESGTQICRNGGVESYTTLTNNGGTISDVCNAAPTVASAIPDTTVVENSSAIDNYRDLKAVFTDAEDGSGLTYSIPSNTNSGLVTASIIPADSTLDLSFTASTTGTATITIRATDSGSSFVDDVFTVTVADQTAPAAVTLATGTVTSSSIDLSWTAPGDDGATGTATAYDVRYSTSTINEANWGSALEASGETSPKAAGLGETFTVTGLIGSTTYYFAIKTSDEVPNVSAISDVPSGTTSTPAAPGDSLTNVATATNVGSNSSYTLNFGWTATAGRLLILTASWDKDVDNLIEFTGGLTTWTNVDYRINADMVTGAMYYKVADGTETSVRLQWTNGEDISIRVGEYSGIVSVDPLDVKSFGMTSGETSSVATGTTAATSQNDEFAIAMMGSDSGDKTNSGRSWSNGFTEVAWVHSSSGDPGLSVAEKDLTSTGTVQTTFTTSEAGDEMVAIVATFKLEASGGGNNTPAVAVAIADTTVAEDNAPIDNYRDLKAVFADVEDGSALTYTIQSNTNSGLVTPTIVTADSTLDLSFTASTSGTATITMRATDAGGLFVDDVFTVTVNGTPTVAIAIADTTVTENASPIDNYRDLKAVFTDAEDGSALTYSIESNTNSGLVTATFVAADSTLDLSFTASTTGTATITIRATDSGSLFVDDVFTVTVNAAAAGSGFDNATGSNTASFSHTIGGGSDRILLYSFASETAGTGDVTNVTYNGVALTYSTYTATASESRVEFWYMLEAALPAAGTYTVTATIAGTGTSFVHGASSWEGVHQTTPFGTIVTNTGSTSTPTVTVNSATDEFVHDFVAVKDASSLTVNASQDQRWNLLAAGTADVHGGGSSEAGDTNVVMSWSSPGAVDWAIIGVPIKPAPTNTAPTVASAIADTTVSRDASPIDNYRDLKAVFTDAEDGSALTYSIQSNTNSGLVTATFVPADSTLDLSFTASTSGTATITIRATDGGSLFVDDVFTVTVNDPPTVASAIPDTTVTENASPIDNYRDLKAVFTDPEDGSALTYAIQSNTNSGLVTPDIVVADSTLDLSFTASTSGTATITIRATDSGGLWVEDVFTVTVDPASTPGTFQDDGIPGGVDETDDARLMAANPTINYAVDRLDIDDGGSLHEHSVLKFPNIFGGGVGAIPLGSSIISATLTLEVSNSGHDVLLYQLIESWDEATVTWDDASTGVSWTYAGADSSHIGTAVGTLSASPTGSYSVDVTASVQNWSFGELNEGWLLKDTGTDGVDIRQSEYATASVRPKLEVTWVPNTAPTVVSAIADTTVTDEQPPPSTATGISRRCSPTQKDGSALTYTIESNTNTGLVTASIIPADSTLDLSFTASTSGTATITMRATDSGGLFVDDVFTVTVNAPPTVAIAIADTTVSRDAAPIDNYRDLKAVFTDAEDGSGLTYTIQSNTNSGLVTATFVPADSTLDLSFTASTSGTATITIRATDGGSLFVEDVFTVTVNDPPTVASAIADTTVSRDAAPIDNYRDLKAVFTDVEDGSALTFSIESNTNSGLVTPTFVVADSTLDLSFTASTSGTATITIRATDGGSLFVEDVFTVTVNDAPTVASAIADTTVNENDPPIDNYRDLKAVFTDVEDGSGLTYSIESNTNSGLVTPTIVAADSTLDLSFTASSSGTATITIRATDSGSLYVEDVFTVTVNAAAAGSGFDNATGSNSASFSHTIGGGSDRILLYSFASETAGTGDVTNVTYNGVALTYSTYTATASESRVEFWYMLEAALPAAGTYTVTATIAGTGTSFVHGASSWEGVHQTTPFGTIVTNTGSTSTPTVTVNSATDEFVHDFVAVKDASSLTVNVSQDQRWNLLAAGTADVHGGGSSEAGDTNVVMSWSSPGAVDWAIIGVPIKPSAAGNATPTVASAIADTTVTENASPIDSYRDLKAVFTDAEDGSALTYTIESNTNTGLVTASIIPADSTLDLSFTASTTGTATITIRATDSGSLYVEDVFTVTVAAPDVTAPDDVLNLGTGTVTTTSIQLTWTSPGDDGATGTATTYDIRYSTTAITEENWASATEATGEPSPQVAGSGESFTVNGLSIATNYYFAIKTSDEASNESAISNVLSAATSNSGIHWGRDVQNSSSTTSAHSRAMGGTPPNTDYMVIDTISMYLGAQTGDVRLAVYTGGTEADPTSATLLWDAGTVNPMGTAGWYSIGHPSGGVAWPKNTVTWLAWKRDTGVAVYYSNSTADAGDFQTARGRNVNGFSAIPGDAYPGTYGAAGTFSGAWYSLFVVHSVEPPNAVTSAVAEISPNDVAANSTANSFTYAIKATIGGTDTGVDSLTISVPSTFGVPTVDDVQVGGSTVGYTSNVVGKLISINLTVPVTVTDSIEVVFSADGPTAIDAGGKDFASTVDDKATSTPAQSSTEGSADSDAGDNNSWTVTTTNQTPTVASAIADTTVVENNAPIDNYRDLKAVFTDTEDGSGLTYSIESNTNSGLVTATFVVADSTLDLSFTASTSGTATITVRATDSGALFVDDVFTVTVNSPAVLLGRYWFNEAPSGQAVATVLDDQASPVNLTVTSDTLEWRLDAGHRGLGVPVAGRTNNLQHAGIASAAVEGTKYKTTLNGATAATFVVVAEWEGGWSDRMAGFQRPGGGRVLLVLTDAGGGLEFRTDSDLSNPRMLWPSQGWDDGVRRVFHFVYDTDHPTDSLRMRLYVDGVDQGIPPSILGGIPPIGDGLNWGFTDIELIALNEPDFTNGFPGSVFYIAVHDGVMTDSEITSDVTALLADDDNITYAVDVTLNGVDSLPRLPSNGTSYGYKYTVTNNSTVLEDFDLFGYPGDTLATFLTVDSIIGPNVTGGATADSARITGVPASGVDSAFVWYSVANVAAGTLDSLYLNSRSLSDTTVSDPGWAFVEVVKPNLAVGKAVSPNGTQLPGTELTYTVTITNDGSDDAAGVVVLDSLPEELDFKVGTVVNNLPSGVNATVEYSNDAGSSWTYTPVSAGCSAPANFDSCVTHIRWTLDTDLSYVGPNNTGNVEFVARIQ